MNQASSSRVSWLVLRVVLACLVAAHGYYRLLTGGVPLFGEALVSLGIPFGLVIAWGVTLSEIIGSLLLVIGRWVPPITVLLSAIYATGIVMVHASNGWFVVGGGRNGVEYSVLLIVALLCVGAQHVPESTKTL